MTSWTLSRVRASGEAYLREMGRARLGELSGRPATATGEIRKAYSQELGRGALDLALEHAEASSPGDAGARSGISLLAWLVELQLDGACAPIDDWLARWRERAEVRTPDTRVVPFADVEREIARESDRPARLALDAARVALLERDVAPVLIDRRARMRDSLEDMGIAGTARESAERLSGDNLADLADAARDALQQSADAWHDSLNDRLRRHLSVSRNDARPSDLAAAIDASLFDAAFRASGSEALVRRTLIELGLDGEPGGGLHVEKLARAPGANAECVALEVPGDIRLVPGRAGGVDAYRSLLQSLGVALRLGNVEGDAPFEHRWLGDPALPAMCARTLSSVLCDEGWLMRHAGVSRSEARRLAAITALHELYELRRSCAAHIHYMETIDADMPAGALRDLYVEVVGNAIGIQPHGADAVLDMPSFVTPGARLRGIQAAAVLGSELVERFDVDWYRNPRTGPWLVQSVLEPARGEPAAEVLKGATGRDLSFGPCIRRLEQALVA